LRERLWEWAQQKAIQYVCPNSLFPQTPYEHGMVKTMRAFILQILENVDLPDLIRALIVTRENLQTMVDESILEYYDFSEIDRVLAKMKGEKCSGTSGQKQINQK
jgi:hypothetical protein